MKEERKEGKGEIFIVVFFFLFLETRLNHWRYTYSTEIKSVRNCKCHRSLVPLRLPAIHAYARTCIHVYACVCVPACVHGSGYRVVFWVRFLSPPVVGSSQGREIEGCCYDKWLVTSQVISPALQPRIILAHDWKEQKFLTTESHFLVCTAALAPTLSFNTLAGL